MGLRKNKNSPRAAALSANGLPVRVGDEVTWPDRLMNDLHTGRVVAVTTTQAQVVDDQPRWGGDVLPFRALTVNRTARDDDKTAALIAVYKELCEQAERDLGIYTFLENDWPRLVPADLRRLLDIGADDDSTPAA